MSTFSNRLKQIRTEKGVTQLELSRLIGVSRSAVAMYENGQREPSFEIIEAIADVLNVRMSKLVDGTGLPAEPVDYNRLVPVPDVRTLGAMVMMPVIGEVKAGYGMQAEEIYTGEYLMVAADAMRGDPSGYRLLQCRGDSMYPFVLDGDLLLVRLQDTAESGETVVAILGNGEATVKRFHVGNGPELVAANPMYPPLQMREGDRIYGKVVRVERVL